MGKGKKNRAAKKAAVKLARQGGVATGGSSQVSRSEQVALTSSTDLSPVLPPEKVATQSKEEFKLQSPTHDVPAAVSSSETQSVFPPLDTQPGKRGHKHGDDQGEVVNWRLRDGQKPTQQHQQEKWIIKEVSSAQPFPTPTLTTERQLKHYEPLQGQGKEKQALPPQHLLSFDQNFPPIGGARSKQSSWKQLQPPDIQSPLEMSAQSLPTVQTSPAEQTEPLLQVQLKDPPPKQASKPKYRQRDTKTMAEKMKHLSLDTLSKPVRPALNRGGKEGRKIAVETNHLQIDLKRLKNKTCIHYDVDIQPERPKRLFREAVEAFRQKHFKNRFPAFDGRKNLIASSFLPGLTEGEELSDHVSVRDEEKNTTKEFTVKMKCVNIIDLTCLDKYMEDGDNLEMPHKAIQMLDIVIRNAPAQKFIQVGRSFFTQPEHVQLLGNGMHMWLGFYQSVILGWKPFLNVDVVHKGFPTSQNVKEAIEELFSTPFYQFNPDKELNKHQEADLSVFLKGLKIEYKLPNQAGTKRTYRVNSACSSANNLIFKLEDGRSTTVAEYFKKEKNYKLQYPKLPCLHVGSVKRNNPIYLPVELCTILPGQVTSRKMTEQQTSAMMKHAATSTMDRMRKIHSAIRSADYNNDPGIQEFGIFINDRFQVVEARVLKSPTLAYKKDNIQPERGVWHPTSFLSGCRIDNWVILNFGVNVHEDELRNFALEMVKTGNGLGMTIQPPQNVITLEKNNATNKLYKALLDCKSAKVDLVIVLIEDRRGIYAQVKQLAELEIGIVTQCLKKRTIMRGDRSTISNVLLKINSKLNGVNHKLSPPALPPCLRRPIMIIGADVTHPSPDQKTIPSVAAVCASHDCDAFQYNLQYRLQSPRQEIIQDLKEIMRSQLLFFYQKTKLKPERLIFYRDGVSEGQFAMVLNEELSQIKAACNSLSEVYEPMITFLVVQKRHHTRFFPVHPEDEDGRNKNVPAGTIVDTTITHPRHIDFYLVSHASIQGVSRPTKYRILWDDSNMSVDELEQLTYYLCHLFSRCTHSVSYPAPTYYAHLAAYRARIYIEGQSINLARLSDEQATRSVKDELAKNFPMFFV